MISLRTDRFTYFEYETVSIEGYICNDTNESKTVAVLFELYQNNKLILSNKINVLMESNHVTYIGNAEFTAPKVNGREKFNLKAVILDGDMVITYNMQTIEIFENIEIPDIKIIKLDIGEHYIAGEKVIVKPCGMLPLHFVSRNTGHRAVKEFSPYDFSYWYNKKKDMITPVLETTFEAEGFTPILTSGNIDKNGKWKKTLACAEKIYKGKRYIICQLDLRCENPVAAKFINNISSADETR